MIEYEGPVRLGGIQDLHVRIDDLDSASWTGEQIANKNEPTPDESYQGGEVTVELAGSDRKGETAQAVAHLSVANPPLTSLVGRTAFKKL